ncbi:MAG: DUF5320 domain-containing protein [Clostridiales bacterium]|nr:DUF5320 domain-containing protein [Clostridiales bacterium]
MPRGDGTGPLGLGPMTGRGAGYCAGFRVSRFLNPVGLRRGLGLGLGLRRGRAFRGPFGFNRMNAGFRQRFFNRYWW